MLIGYVGAHFDGHIFVVPGFGQERVVAAPRVFVGVVNFDVLV